MTLKQCKNCEYYDEGIEECCYHGGPLSLIEDCDKKNEKEDKL